MTTEEVQPNTTQKLPRSIIWGKILPLPRHLTAMGLEKSAISQVFLHIQTALGLLSADFWLQEITFNILKTSYKSVWNYF